MRFLSRFGMFGVQIRPRIEEAFATGIAKTTQEPVYAMFSIQGLTPDERDLANAHWRGGWNGFYQAEDEVTIIPPDYRIGLFDSRIAQIDQGWDDATREEVERVLTDLAIRFNDMILVPVVTAPAPWPRYDEYTGSPAALARKLVDEGYDLAAVLDYERENQNREKVIAEIEQAMNDSASAEELEVVG